MQFHAATHGTIKDAELTPGKYFTLKAKSPENNRKDKATSPLSQAYQDKLSLLSTAYKA